MLNIFLKTEVKAASYEIDQVAGNSEQFKGQIKENGGQFTDDDLDVVAGRRDQLIGKKPGELRHYQVRGWK